MTRNVLMQFRAEARRLLMAVGNDEAVWPLLKNSPEPTLRTDVIHGCSPVCTSPDDVLASVDDQEDVSVRRAMLLVAGELSGDPAESFDTRASLRRLRRESVDRLSIGCIETIPIRASTPRASGCCNDASKRTRLLRSSRTPVLVTAGDRQWYVNGQGHTMIVVPGASPVPDGGARRPEVREVGSRLHYQTDPDELQHRQHRNDGRTVPPISWTTNRGFPRERLIAQRMRARLAPDVGHVVRGRGLLQLAQQVEGLPEANGAICQTTMASMRPGCDWQRTTWIAAAIVCLRNPSGNTPAGRSGNGVLLWRRSRLPGALRRLRS